MKYLNLIFGFILWNGIVMADESDMNLIKKVQAFADLTAQATQFMPSVLLDSPEDGRIDKIGDTLTQPFLIHSEGSEKFIVIINPNKKNGFLWWKSSDRLIFQSDRWEKIKSGAEKLNEKEKNFIQSL